MINLIQTIEMYDPGHFDRRYNYLLELSEEVRTMGFFPLQITRNDIECYWIRLQTKSNDVLNLSVEMVEDMKVFPDLMKSLKEVAKHETR